jgi:hypothetical protein
MPSSQSHPMLSISLSVLICMCSPSPPSLSPSQLAAWVDDQIESAKTNLTEAKAEGSIASKLLHKVVVCVGC